MPINSIIYAALNILNQIIINSKIMNFNVLLSFRKYHEKTIRLHGINRVMSKYWYYLGREGYVFDEYSWWI